MKEISKIVKWIKLHGLYPETPVVSSAHAPEVVVNSRKVLMFATNNYLGMLHDSRVIDASVEGTKKWGIGNGSARLLTGNLVIHDELEKKISGFKKRESALTFVSGYMANEGAIPALANILKPTLSSFLKGEMPKEADTVIFSDEYNHASIIAGIKLSGAQKEIYKHCNLGDLKEKLLKYPKSKRKIIITDGVFSMDGDIAPLPEILTLAKDYNSIVYLDDAHATGILGKNGRGLEDYFNLEGSCDIIMGTFTKAFGGVGGFIVSNQDTIDYLKITASTFIFTAPIPPPVVCGLLKSIEIVKKETWRRKKVLENANYLREKLQELKLDCGNSHTQIIPIIIGDEKKAMEASKLLLENNIFIPTARWPAVPKGRARLRITVTCEHTKNQLDNLLENMKKIRNILKF